MIDRLLEILHTILPFLNYAAALIFIIKAVIVIRNKGFNLPAVFFSVFRVYSKSEMYMTNNTARQKYMRLNNLLNYYLYTWALILIIIILVFQSPY